MDFLIEDLLNDEFEDDELDACAEADVVDFP
jgi:hypothetical protein